MHGPCLLTIWLPVQGGSTRPSPPGRCAQFCATAHTSIAYQLPLRMCHTPSRFACCSELRDHQCPLSSWLYLCQVPPLSIPVQADVRSYNWQPLIQASCFDVILMDPPWQLATANPTRGEVGACCTHSVGWLHWDLDSRTCSPGTQCILQLVTDNSRCCLAKPTQVYAGRAMPRQALQALPTSCRRCCVCQISADAVQSSARVLQEWRWVTTS